MEHEHYKAIQQSEDVQYTIFIVQLLTYGFIIGMAAIYFLIGYALYKFFCTD